jgi:hypothetical protein
MNLHLSKGTTERVFMAADTNKDDTLNYREFVQAFDAPSWRRLLPAFTSSAASSPAKVLAFACSPRCIV